MTNRYSGPRSYLAALLCAAALGGGAVHAQSLSVAQARQQLRRNSDIERYVEIARAEQRQAEAVRDAPPLRATTAVRMRNLTDKPIASREDALRTVAVLVEGRWPEDGIGEVASRLKFRGVASDDLVEGTAAAATRGYASLLFSRAMGEKGGVMRFILPGNQRYAYRDLLHLGIVGPGGEGVRISGGELASMVGLARARMRVTGHEIPGGAR